MAQSFGDFDPAATRAINRLSWDTGHVGWIPHAREEMEKDGFDDTDVLDCLRRGKAYGPEFKKGNERYNVLHSGLHIRVAVEVPDGATAAAAKRLRVITVMRFG